MDIRLGQISLGSLARIALLANLAAWLSIGLVMAGLEAAGVAVLDPEIPPVPLVERIVVAILACLLIGAVHSVLLVAGAWLVRSAASGLALRLRADARAVSRTFE